MITDQTRGAGELFVIGSGLTGWPHPINILPRQPVVRKALRDYDRGWAIAVDPHVAPHPLGINRAGCWEEVDPATLTRPVAAADRGKG